MKADSLMTEVILTHPHQFLGKIQLDWRPQPGNYIELAGQTYAVLESHHHYRYQIGGYCLNKISLYVQIAQPPTEKSLLDGCWIVGDINCRFNANSEILRCAVNPEGPCQNCRFFDIKN
ncbi:DUF6464 family protein [Crocosphaera sp. XPORK-15E]|uniref:DUF6464 family protein n=1 Tax=Crocosphaera sp. XPORK-15E TaxID=3110247 RepID=UPI002B21773B|nr:DUF6464 family protein [Crocosphaera sp. XPORK-15E]MEA5533247.1 DUF6464 family protein [Crocosphaera sp. XPORK-15E]